MSRPLQPLAWALGCPFASAFPPSPVCAFRLPLPRVLLAPQATGLRVSPLRRSFGCAGSPCPGCPVPRTSAPPSAGSGCPVPASSPHLTRSRVAPVPASPACRRFRPSGCPSGGLLRRLRVCPASSRPAAWYFGSASQCAHRVAPPAHLPARLAFGLGCPSPSTLRCAGGESPGLPGSSFLRSRLRSELPGCPGSSSPPAALPLAPARVAPRLRPFSAAVS